MKFRVSSLGLLIVLLSGAIGTSLAASHKGAHQAKKLTAVESAVPTPPRVATFTPTVQTKGAHRVAGPVRAAFVPVTELWLTWGAKDWAFLQWDAHTNKSVRNFRVYYGTSSGAYADKFDAGNTTLTRVPTKTTTPGGVTFYAVSAVDTNGFESDFSDEVVYTNGPVKFVAGIARTINSDPEGVYEIQSKSTITAPWQVDGMLTNRFLQIVPGGQKYFRVRRVQ